MNKIQQIEQQQLWMSRINDLASSGLTQSQWCQEKGFSVSTLRYWMRKLREPEEQDSTSWLQVDIPEGGHVASLPVSSNAASSGLDIPSIGTMRSGVSVPTNPDLGSNGSGKEPL